MKPDGRWFCSECGCLAGERGGVIREGKSCFLKLKDDLTDTYELPESLCEADSIDDIDVTGEMFSNSDGGRVARPIDSESEVETRGCICQ